MSEDRINRVQEDVELYKEAEFVFLSTSRIDMQIKFTCFDLFIRKWAYGLLLVTLFLIFGVYLLCTDRTILAILIIAFGLASPILLFMVRVPRIKVKLENNHEFRNTLRDFAFYQDMFLIAIKYEGKEDSKECYYESIKKIYERKDAYYVYISDGFSFLIAKNDISKGSIEGLNSFLKLRMGNKFISRG